MNIDELVFTSLAPIHVKNMIDNLAPFHMPSFHLKILHGILPEDCYDWIFGYWRSLISFTGDGTRSPQQTLGADVGAFARWYTLCDRL